MKLTPKEYHKKYCTSCQYIWCDGPFGDRDNNTHFQECAHHEEVMTVKEELTDILYDALDKVVPVENALSFEDIEKVAQILYEKGWREIR